MLSAENADRIDVWLQTLARPWREIVDVMMKAGRQLAADHAAGKIHEDIRLDNIFVSSDGQVSLRDLLPAKPAGERGANPTEELRTAAHSLQQRMAALDSMRAAMSLSPEQFRGGTAEPASTQFSFCVALYRALYGQAPFDADVPSGGSQARHTPLGSVSLSLLLGAFDRTTFINMAREVLSGNIRRPPDGLDVPPWLFPILERGMSVDVDDRYRSMNALLDDIVAGLGGSRKRAGVTDLSRTWILIAGAALALF